MLSLAQVLPEWARERGITDERCFAPGREAARRLFEAYLAELGEDLTFQGVAEELASLPGRYGPPRGTLLVAWDGDQAVACGALRDLGEETAELKRLYVEPSHRGTGEAARMLGALIESARTLGHRRLVLDTLERLEPANRLYRSAGFRPVEPYYANPLPGVLYLGLDL